MIDYIFDNLGRLTEEKWGNTSGTSTKYKWKYDLAGQLTDADDSASLLRGRSGRQCPRQARWWVIAGNR